jgi:flagellar hook protein FlgE
VDYKAVEVSGYDPNTGADSNFTFKVNYADLRQLASDFIFYAEQDGNSKGDLISLAVSEDGVIKATYSNGKVKDIARLAIATFKDKEMLVRKGEGLYLPNMQTFTPVIMPGGVISKIRSGMLEMSNVDIANEFINLITAQRSYQANARVITTDDQILQETMNIKR